LRKEHYQDYELFKDTLLSFMVKGFAIEEVRDTTKGYEQKLEKKYGVKIEDIKKPEAPLIKLVHTSTKEGFFRKLFTMTGAQFDHDVLRYVMQHYYEESERNEIGVYVVVGFRKLNEEFNNELIKIERDTHQEPFQIFVARSHANTTIDVGRLIQEVKQATGITNGGGRDSVGGMNTADKNKAIKALNLFVDYIRENCP
jgi:hypothetical protein